MVDKWRCDEGIHSKDGVNSRLQDTDIQSGGGLSSNDAGHGPNGGTEINRISEQVADSSNK
jgi:hypothetical protein